MSAYDNTLAGSPHRFGDYDIGEKIDHVDGMTVEDAEHMLATRCIRTRPRSISISLRKPKNGSVSALFTVGM